MINCAQLSVRVGVKLLELFVVYWLWYLFTGPYLLCYGIREWRRPQGPTGQSWGLQRKKGTVLHSGDHCSPAIPASAWDYSSVSVCCCCFCHHWNDFLQVCILFGFNADDHFWTLYVIHHKHGYKLVVLYDIFMFDVPNFTVWGVSKYFCSYFVSLVNRDVHVLWM